MDNMQAAEFVFDRNSFRIGALFWLATCNDGMDMTRDLKDAFEEGDLQDVFELPDYMLGDDVGAEEFSGWLMDERKLGFLARVETPRPTAVHKTGYSSHGWGVYSCKWVYAETTDELLEMAERASKEYIESELTKLRGKK